MILVRLCYDRVVNDLSVRDPTPRNYETMSYVSFITYVGKAGMLKKQRLS